ncbi:MarR family winged helix-turn-helix transcriptional regulator [Streptomyces sp. NPDC001315]|uniref:MarR family winged helix-turn-helix transcriptional regulator n=1 Tax=Streptomyces sp. NPDC001315 TaxID=3364562 RepID=UPI0036C8F473
MHKQVMDSGVAEVSAEDLMGAVEQLVRYVRRGTTAGGLSQAASSALNRLGREGPLRLSELARAENVSQPNMTQLITRMEKAGLARRTADASDGRGVLVEATDTGREVFRRRQTERARALQRLVGGLPEADQQAVRVALPALARAIRDQSPGQGPEAAS